MGLDVSSNLVVGVEVERFMKTVESNKFNPDTGAPVVVRSQVKAFRICGTQIEVEEPTCCVDYESDSGWFFGVEYKGSGSHRNSKYSFEVVPGELPFDEARKLLDAVGYSGVPKVFVYTCLSY